MKTITSSIAQPKYCYTPIFQNPDIAFFDIETTGLSPNASSIYLIGLLYYNPDQKEWQLTQWFADNYQSEKEILSHFLDMLESFSCLYHFNGNTFDIPYVRKKCTRHKIQLSAHCKQLFDDKTGCFSIDLLAKIRPLKHLLSLEKCNQTALERYLDIYRDDPFSGRDLIQAYSEYMQKKLLQPKDAEKLEKVLLLHNYEDIIMMRELCILLCYQEYFSTDCTKRLLNEKNLSSLSVLPDEADGAAKAFSLTLALPDNVPKEIRAQLASDQSAPPISIHLKNSHAELSVPVYHGTLKYFLPNYKEYYYLPEEDIAVHKSIALFMDNSHRQKATASTCYVKKEGAFLPCPTVRKRKQPPPEWKEKLFSASYRDKQTFVAVPSDAAKKIFFWQGYLSHILPNVI